MAIVLRSLSILLGLFFIFVGTMKLTSYLSKDLHKDLVSFYFFLFFQFHFYWVRHFVLIERQLKATPVQHF